MIILLKAVVTEPRHRCDVWDDLDISLERREERGERSLTARAECLQLKVRRERRDRERRPDHSQLDQLGFLLQLHTAANNKGSIVMSVIIY